MLSRLSLGLAGVYPGNLSVRNQFNKIDMLGIRVGDTLRPRVGTITTFGGANVPGARRSS